METVYFLCGNFLNNNFIYAIKSDLSDWYYFEEQDSFLDVHVSLPPNLVNEISKLTKVQRIGLTLNADQIVNYINNGTFVFRGKKLKTFIQLSGIAANQRYDDQSNPRKKAKLQSTHDLAFEAGKTNPAIFLKEFDKCLDLKTERDKLYTLRNFVKENDRPEFSTLFFTSDWQTARSTFLKKYSLEFTENKKKELCFSFEKETSLRSFVERKINAMSIYTSLSLVNQLEIILSELPNDIASIFIAEDKLNGTKAEILEVCDLIQEYCESTHNETTTPTTGADVPSDVDQELEIFNFHEDSESSSDTGSTSTISSGRSKAKKIGRSSRPVVIPRTISEEEYNSESDSNQMDEYSSEYSNC